MKKWIVLLCGLLVLQLLVAVIVHLTGEEYGAYEADEKLLDFEINAVDRIKIEAGSNSAVLAKQSENWVLPNHDNFPADQKNVTQLLDKLAAMKKGWPVATTSSASRRFKVAEDEYERKLTLLTNNEVLAQLYIGNSPGFRKVHVRNADDDEVFSVAFNTWEASADSDDWINKSLLTFSAEDLLRIEMSNFVLQRVDGELQLADLTDEEEIDKQAAQTLVNSLSNLQIESVQNNENKIDNLPDEADFIVKMLLKPDEKFIYRFFKLNEEPYYLLKRSDSDRYFEIAEFHVNAIKALTRDKLLQVDDTKASDEIIENETVESDADFD